MENRVKINRYIAKDVKNYGYLTEIVQQDYTFIDSNTFQKIRQENHFFKVDEEDITQFIEGWNTLEMDQFLSDRGKYRSRKQTTFIINAKDRIELKNNVEFSGVLVLPYKKA